MEDGGWRMEDGGWRMEDGGGDGLLTGVDGGRWRPNWDCFGGFFPSSVFWVGSAVVVGGAAGFAEGQDGAVVVALGVGFAALCLADGFDEAAVHALDMDEVAEADDEGGEDAAGEGDEEV